MRLRSRPLRSPLLLVVDLSESVIDGPARGLLGRRRTARRHQLRQLVDTLGEAAEDDRVRAVMIRVDRPADSWAHAEELRGAVSALRNRGKRVVAHARSFGEVGDGTLAYYVATASDEIHLQSTGDVGLTGLAAEVPFAGDLVDKLGVIPQLDHRHEYKTAANLITERRFTAPHREVIERIVASRHEQLVAAIAEGRGVDRERAAAMVDEGPLLGPDALSAGLVDRLAYRDETLAAVKEEVGPQVRLVTVRQYRPAWQRRLSRRRTTVALVHAHGAIQVGRSRWTPFGARLGADTVVMGFTQALRDRRVRAILFRVDSPGGSAVASDAIWRAVVRAREAGKPVVVSMGAVAGSGGYWVSTPADRIVASPGTLTGSIGVVAGKFVTRGLGERLGISVDEAHRGANALMFSHNREFSPEQWDRMGGFLDRIYDEFVRRVVDGRGLSRERVEQLARGRVWTGADAEAHGLIDELGGYREALGSIRRLLGLDPRAAVRLRTLPRESLLQRLGLRRPDPEDIGALRAVVGGALRAAGLLEDGVARMPPWTSSVR